MINSINQKSISIKGTIQATPSTICNYYVNSIKKEKSMNTKRKINEISSICITNTNQNKIGIKKNSFSKCNRSNLNNIIFKTEMNTNINKICIKKPPIKINSLSKEKKLISKKDITMNFDNNNYYITPKNLKNIITKKYSGQSNKSTQAKSNSNQKTNKKSNCSYKNTIICYKTQNNISNTYSTRKNYELFNKKYLKSIKITNNNTNKNYFIKIQKVKNLNHTKTTSFFKKNKHFDTLERKSSNKNISKNKKLIQTPIHNKIITNKQLTTYPKKIFINSSDKYIQIKKYDSTIKKNNNINNDINTNDNIKQSLLERMNKVGKKCNYVLKRGVELGKKYNGKEIISDEEDEHNYNNYCDNRNIRHNKCIKMRISKKEEEGLDNGFFLDEQN
jgi:hypothetical protein